MEIVAEFSSHEECIATEVALIYKWGRKDLGTGILCNHTDGGEGVQTWVATDEAREKMSKAKLGNKINVGRKRPDTVEKFSKPISIYDENGDWLKCFCSARKAEQETGIDYRKISETLVGKLNRVKIDDKFFTFRYGQEPVSVGYIGGKRQQPNRNKGIKIIQRTLDGTFVASYDSIIEAKNVTGLSGISQCLCGKSKTAGKFLWSKETN